MQDNKVHERKRDMIHNHISICCSCFMQHVLNGVVFCALELKLICFYLLFRRKHHSSLQPVKAAFRQPRSFWSILPIARSQTTLTSYPEISPRNACTMTSSASWTSTMWFVVLDFTTHPWVPPVFPHLSPPPMTTLAIWRLPCRPRRFENWLLLGKVGRTVEKMAEIKRKSHWMGRVTCWTRQPSSHLLSPLSHRMGTCLMWPLLPWHHPSSSLHLSPSIIYKALGTFWGWTPERT